MNTDELLKDNPHKQRTIEDIARFLKTRVEKNPNYCLLLGAGCSVTSGIPSGGELIDKWKREIFEEFGDRGSQYSQEAAQKLLKEKFSQWYNENNEYSSLFEKKYDLPSQRRKFIEELVSEKIPSIGYAYLVNLVKNNYLNSIFTTNFDDLLNEAFYHYSDRRPMLCAHDSSVTSINLYSSRPKIIKLHGDYLFDDIKGSLRETESLEENTKNKLVETLKGQGLISVGYAGNDRSVMDVIGYLLRLEDHLSNGIYWCVRKGEHISEEVRKLLWRDRVYYVIIDGFDEFFAELNLKLTGSLSLEQNLINNKTSKIIESYTANNYLLNSNSETIKSDIERLSKQKTKSNISRLIQQLNEKDQVSNLDDNEIAALMTIESQIQEHDFSNAIKSCNEELAKSSNQEMQTALTRILARVYELSDQNSKAIECHEKLKKVDPNDPRPYIAIAAIETNPEKKLAILDEAIKVAPHDYISYDKKAAIIAEKATHLPSQIKGDIQETGSEAMEKSLRLNPSYKNPSWGRYFDLVNASDLPDDDKKAKLKQIIDKLDEQGPFNQRSIALKISYHNKHSNDIEKRNFFAQLQEQAPRTRKTEEPALKTNLLKAANKFKYKKEAGALISEILDSPLDKQLPEARITSGIVLAELFGDFNRAAEVLKEAKGIEDSYEGLYALLRCQAIISDTYAAEETLKKIQSQYNQVAYLSAAAELYDTIGQCAKSLKVTQQLLEATQDKFKYTSLHAYNLIRNNETEAAKRILSELLTEYNFDRNLVSEIVNFEICKKLLGGKCDKARLGESLSYARADLERAAIYALLDEENKALEKLKSALEDDKTDITALIRWPAFNSLRENREFKQILESTLNSKQPPLVPERSSALKVV